MSTKFLHSLLLISTLTGCASGMERNVHNTSKKITRDAVLIESNNDSITDLFFERLESLDETSVAVFALLGSIWEEFPDTELPVIKQPLHGSAEQVFWPEPPVFYQVPPKKRYKKDL